METRGARGLAPRARLPAGPLALLGFSLAAVAFLVEMVGGVWDILYHLDGGVEVFWTPPHLLLYGGIAVTFGASANGLLFARRAGLPAAFQAALGTVLLGGLLKFGAGLFDSWWHAALGVDDALSPPHVLMLVGMGISGFGLSRAGALLRETWDRRTRSGGFARAARAAAPFAWTGWLFALLGLAWVLSHPGFAGDPFLPEPWRRLGVAFAFAVVLGFVPAAARASLQSRGPATAVLGLFGTTTMLVRLVQDEASAAFVALPFAGLAAGAVLDAALGSRGSPWARGAARVGEGLTLGLLGVVLLDIAIGDMTGGLAGNGLLFPIALATGGLAGSLLGPVLARRLAAPAVVGPAPAGIR